MFFKMTFERDQLQTVRVKQRHIRHGRLIVRINENLERINVQFNVRESLAEKVKAWNKDEVHTMRGRIVSKGDLEDDVIFECADSKTCDFLITSDRLFAGFHKSASLEIIDPKDFVSRILKTCKEI